MMNKMDSDLFRPFDCKKLITLQDCRFALKASVHIKQCEKGGSTVVVKDFSHSPWILRGTLCRVFLNREIRALKRLQGIKGIPQYLGRYGNNGFVMELVKGNHPTKKHFKHSKYLTDQLYVLLENIHGAGVTHNDVRMKNIIVNDSKQLFMIDYAASFIVGDPFDFSYYLKLPLYKLLKFIDESRVAEFKQLHDAYYISPQRNVLFRIVKKMHIIVDAWKYLLKFFRKI